MSRQFITARFSLTDARAYTYHNDGEAVAPGPKSDRLQQRAGPLHQRGHGAAGAPDVVA